MRRHKTAEPFAQVPGLGRHLVEFAGQGVGADAVQHGLGDQFRLAQPIQQPFAIGDPIDRNVDGRRDRIEEIQAGRVGDEQGRGMNRHRSSPITMP